MRESFNISVTRFFVCIYLLIFQNSFPDLSYDLSAFQATGIFHILPAPIDPSWFLPIKVIWMISLLVAALGFVVPWSMGLAVLSGSYVLGYSNCFGEAIIGTALAYTFIWLLFLSELSKNKAKFVKLMQVIIVLQYLIPGIQKLIASGWQWAWSENLAVYIYANRMTPAAEFLLSMDPVFVRILAATVLAIELLSPLALIGRKTAFVFICLWAGMHIGIQVVFDFHKTFLSAIPCLLIFIDWNAILPTRVGDRPWKFHHRPPPKEIKNPFLKS